MKNTQNFTETWPTSFIGLSRSVPTSAWNHALRGQINKKCIKIYHNRPKECLLTLAGREAGDQYKAIVKMIAKVFIFIFNFLV